MAQHQGVASEFAAENVGCFAGAHAVHGRLDLGGKGRRLISPARELGLFHLAVSRQIAGEEVVLGIEIRYPERLPLPEIDAVGRFRIPPLTISAMTL